MLTSLSAELTAGIPLLPAALLLLATGVMLLVFGWHAWRVTLFLTGAFFGGAAGMLLAAPLGLAAILLMLPLALIGGIVALFLQKVGAFIAGGLCATVPVAAFHGFFTAQATFWVATGLAFLIGGILAIWLWRPMIVASLAILGGAMVSDAAMLVWRHFHSASAESFLNRYPWGPLAACGVLALIGIYAQLHHVEKPDGENH